ncbi:MAG TPA: hypothetical protein VI756_21945, partial [Blastocatellia bacterium]
MHIVISLLLAGFVLSPAPRQGQSTNSSPNQAKSAPSTTAPPASSSAAPEAPATPAAPAPSPAASSSAAGAPPKAAQPTPAKRDDTAKKDDNDCGCEVKLPPNAIAIVDGTKITGQEIDDLIKDQVDQLQSRIIQARNREVDLEINSKLLAAEAKRRGITESQLVDHEVVSRVAKPTEAEAKDFFEKNKNRIDGEFDQLKQDIIGYLLDRREREQAKKFSDSLRAQADVKIYATHITPPRTELDRARI